MISFWMLGWGGGVLVFIDGLNKGENIGCRLVWLVGFVGFVGRFTDGNIWSKLVWYGLVWFGVHMIVGYGFCYWDLNG